MHVGRATPRTDEDSRSSVRSVCHTHEASMAKISGPLEDRLRTAAPGELVEVVLELVEERPRGLPVDKSARHAALERHFGASTEVITKTIQMLGGQVLGSSWLGSAIKARLPVECIERLQSLDRVELIDLPRQITRG